MAHLVKKNSILVSSKDENQTTHLEIENRNTEKLRLEIVALNEKIESTEKDLRKMSELEIELQKEKEKTKSLKKQIQEAEDDSISNEKLVETRLKYWNVNKELKIAKVDKKIVERELKDANEENKKLVKQIDMQKNKMEEDKKSQEMALLELKLKNESFCMEIITLKDKEINLQTMMHKECKQREYLNSVIEELKYLKSKEEKTVERLRSQLEDMKIKLGQFQKESIQSAEKLKILSSEKVDLRNRLQHAEWEHQKIYTEFAALREACVLLENQVIAFERINQTYKEKEKSLNSKIQTLISELRTSKDEVQQAEQLLNDEKSSKFEVETEVQRMSEEIESLKIENEDYKKQLTKNQQFSDRLSEQLDAYKKEMTDLQISKRSSERQIEDLVREISKLNREQSEYRIRLNKFSEINYQLNLHMDELKANNNTLKNKVHDLDSTLQGKIAYYEERELKSEATIKQQMKLIDYLHTKIEASQPKKKNFTLFGQSKENLPPISLPMNYKDLELELQKEKATNKLLQEENHRLRVDNSKKMNDDNSRQTSKVDRRKSDVVPRKNKMATQKLEKPSCSQSKDSARKNSIQRMLHKNPHRFESKLCTKPTKCDHCRKNIITGRYMSICKECRILTHSDCSTSVRSTCGHPQELSVNEYENIMYKLPSTSQETATSKDIVNVESTIKIFGQSGSWEKRYAVLTNTHLKVYTEESERYTSKVEQIFELKPKVGRGKVLQEPLMSEIDVMVAESDLPFFLKIEISPNTTCWPSKSFVFLTLSIEDKDMWYKALQNAFQGDNENAYCETIISLPEDITVNCFIDLTENIKALGTTKGLFCSYNGDLICVGGFEEVHHMALLPLSETIAMIVNEKNILVTCDLNHLINVTQCKAAFAKKKFSYDIVNVRGLNGFHLLESCKNEAHRMFCVATPKQLIVMNYDEKEDKFLPLRILDTAEPTGTVLFTDHSIIVGADKFFKIDIKTFVAEEFLDSSNAKLQDVLKSYNLKPYPLSIVEVSGNPREYLVSFNEFSIFVDEYGCPSRKKVLTFNHIPIDVFYMEQHLYVVEFFAVELRKITVDTCASEQEEEEHESDVSRIRLNKFQLVGANERGIYVWHKNAIKLIEARRCLPCDDSSLLETTNGENSSSRFSFSLSMLQSLDGHLNEIVPDENEITFKQTSL